MKCPKCGYGWSPRKEHPVSCPRCKRRFDYPVKPPPPGPGGMSGPRRGGRPAPDWKLADSIAYIRMRDEYLQREGILVRIGERKWRMSAKGSHAR